MHVLPHVLVAVTVTVRSVDVMDDSKLVELADGTRAPIVVKLEVVEPNPVSCDDSDAEDRDDPDVVEAEEVGSSTAGTVNVPKPLNVTATSPVDTETCTAVLASFTLTSTIAAETVTSGLRGPSFCSKFLLTYCGR